LKLYFKGLDNDSDTAIMMSDNTAKLTSAVNTLPQLLEKKRLIDMHTTIATGTILKKLKLKKILTRVFAAILNHIKARKLDSFFEVEEKVMGKVALDKGIMEVITDNESSTPEDKMRLFIIYYICSQTMTEASFTIN